MDIQEEIKINIELYNYANVNFNKLMTFLYFEYTNLLGNNSILSPLFILPKVTKKIINESKQNMRAKRTHEHIKKWLKIENCANERLHIILYSEYASRYKSEINLIS
jgi:predicted RNA methylase